MRTAKRTDQDTEALPEKRTTIVIDRVFSSAEMDRIRMGLIPEQMEDKWFTYFDNDVLYFHRSWTGMCMYQAHFVKEGESYRITTAEVNRDKEWYKNEDDAYDVGLILYLIDALLLGRHDVPFPQCKKFTDPTDQALHQWAMVGRAMPAGGVELIERRLMKSKAD